MPTLSNTDLGRIVSWALIAVIVPIALGFFYRAARRDSTNHFAERCVDYPKALKIFVLVAWIFVFTIAIIAGFTARGDDLIPAVICILLFTLLILALHLEAYLVKVVWDDESIQTRSPWRRSRTIPISSVHRCDFSQSMQWYRLHTEGHGIVRLHMFARGIPQLLAALPVPNPGCPPSIPNKGEDDARGNR